MWKLQKKGEGENKVYLVLVIQNNNMSVHLQVGSEMGCKLTDRNLLNFPTFKVDKPHGELKGGAPAQSVRI